MTRVLKQSPSHEQFSICWGGTCAEVVSTFVTQQEWRRVHALFEPLPPDAAAERAAIAQAIGILEDLIGAKAGTDDDRAGTFGNSAWPGQLDCNDEAVNSTTYMRLMLADGLLRFHRISNPTTRGGFLIFGRHSSAVIQEVASGEKFAVDAWFYDNGQPAVILPLSVWKDGWRPDDSKAR